MGAKNVGQTTKSLVWTQKLAELPLTGFLAASIYPALFYRTLKPIATSLSTLVFRGP